MTLGRELKKTRLLGDMQPPPLSPHMGQMKKKISFMLQKNLNLYSDSSDRGDKAEKWVFRACWIFFYILSENQIDFFLAGGDIFWRPLL